MQHSLKVFVTVAEKQNFTRAAEELHMTQPAVSQFVQTLERSLGTKLLERSNKYVRLTKAGEIVYHHAKEILGLYARMQRLVEELMNTPKGDIAIGASLTFGEYILPHIIARLRKQFPLILPHITIGNTQEIAEAVAHHQLDLGIVEGHLANHGLCVEPFAEDAMYIIVSASHRWAQQTDVSAGELAQETWIVREAGSGTREAVEKMFAQFHICPQKILEFGSTQLIKEAVEAGLGITLLSHWAVRKEISLGTLRSLTIEGAPMTRQFSMVTRATAFHTKATEMLMELMRKWGIQEK